MHILHIFLLDLTSEIRLDLMVEIMLKYDLNSHIILVVFNVVIYVTPTQYIFNGIMALIICEMVIFHI